MRIDRLNGRANCLMAVAEDVLLDAGKHRVIDAGMTP